MADTLQLDCVVAGLRPSFFPMRPMTGRRLLSLDDIKRVCEQAETGEWVLQPKLNGDRVTLTRTNDHVYLFNRHGKCFKHTVLNEEDYLALPEGTVLDGEVYDKHFTPFECLVYGGHSLMNDCVRARIHEAKRIADQFDEWIFEAPTFEELVELWQDEREKRVPKWEGVVKKKTNEPYIPLGSDGQESQVWFKHKWAR